MLTGLMKLELSDGSVVRICDGGFVDWAGERFTARDPEWGVVSEMEPLAEGVGDEAPAFRVTFSVAVPPARLARPEFQGSRCRWWIAEIDRATNKVFGSPEQQADMMIDRMPFSVQGGDRSLTVEFIPTAERVFDANIGNSLNPRSHKAMYPGELGEDNATGLVVPVAWGIESR